MFFVVIINWCILFVCFTLALYEKTNESEVDVQHLTFIFSPSISLRFHQCVKQMTWSENKIKESLDFFTVLLLSNHKFIRAYIVSPTEKYEQGQTCKLSEIIFHPEISHSPCVVVFVRIVSLLALFKLWLGWFWPNQVTCILRWTSYSCHVLWLLWKRLWHCVTIQRLWSHRWFRLMRAWRTYSPLTLAETWRWREILLFMSLEFPPLFNLFLSF